MLVAGPRFSLQGVNGGYLRLDVDRGNVAFCAAHDTGWNCRPVAEDCTAREKEMIRLNDTATMTLLKQQIAALRALPPSPPPRAKEDGDRTIKLPSHGDIARAGTYLQDTAKDAWQRPVDMISHFQKDVMRRS